VPVHTLDEPQHHSPVPIAWHEESRTFFVGTIDDGSVYRGSMDASSATLVTGLRDPSFHDATAVARVGDRYLVVNAGWNDPPPYTISSVPVAS